MATDSSAPLIMDPTIPESRGATNDGFSSAQQGSRFRCCQPGFSNSEVIAEIKMLYSICLPLIITGLLSYGRSFISMLFMGRLGKDALAGGSLAIGIANITGYSVISGLAQGMEAISSQAFGAGQLPLMGKTLQRTILILLFTCIPISLLWLKIKPILLIFHQDPTISSIASVYLTFCLPDLIFQALIHPLKIYLRSQNITLPLMLSAAYALALHAPINYFLIHHLHLGIRGIALGVVAMHFNLLVALIAYIYFSGIHKKSWEGWSVECFEQWRQILSLGWPSCLSVCLEWWWYELMILFSGVLVNAREAVAAMGILIQATSLIYIFPSSLSLAVSTRVGNELGANQPNKARTSSHVALFSAMMTSFVAMSFMVFSRNFWARAFTEDRHIVALTAMALPVVGLCELGNCPQTTLAGVLKGSARPSVAAKINLGSFYCVGLPLAIVMGFGLELGFGGLWLGLLGAQFVCAFLMIWALRKTNWVAQAHRSRELIGVQVDHEDQGGGLVSS